MGGGKGYFGAIGSGRLDNGLKSRVVNLELLWTFGGYRI